MRRTAVRHAFEHDASSHCPGVCASLDRGVVIAGLSAMGASLGLTGCATSIPATSVQNSPPAPEPQFPEASYDRAQGALYGPINDGRFAIAAVKLSDINPVFLRKTVPYATREAVGTIVVDPPHHYLYFVQQGGSAVRYGVGVGGEGFGWAGAATVHEKQEWPDWYPPKEMLERRPELKKEMSELRGGLGMPGGPRNPLGARAMYLWQGNKDTLYRIHGTNEPWTIGRSVSSGCIRMINQDAVDLYQRTPVGTKVVVLSARIS
jgi:lipoprotein-anchoring transpeptidase ErfK/SrfK